MFHSRILSATFAVTLLLLGGCDRAPVEVGILETETTPIPTATPKLEGRAWLDEKKIAFTPDEFIRAAAQGDLEILRAFLSAGMPPDSIDGDHGSAVAGASIDLPDGNKKTPLMRAAESGSPDAVILLLHAGANPALTDAAGNTAFALALQAGKTAVAQHFLQAGLVKTEITGNAAVLLPLAVQTGNRDLLLHLLAAEPRGLYWQDLVAHRFLQAFWEGDVELVHALRLAHATPPRLPGHQQNLLAYTVAWDSAEKVQMLLAEGVSPDEVLIPTNDDHFLNLLNTPRLRDLIQKDEKITPLILAAALGYGDVMQVLLEAGANRYAMSKGSVGAVEFVGGNWNLLKLLLPPDPKRVAPFRVKIDLSEQWAYYHEGDRMIMKCIVSTGRPGFETPAGRFLITDKHRSKISSLYDVEMPWFMRLNGSAVGIHAGPTNGHAISHGCIRMPDGAAKMLFQRAPVGTLVTIEP